MTRTIFSPYRICPLGAHVDHQGGAVLGNTIHLGTTLVYSPLDSQDVHITSEQWGEKRFTIGEEIDAAHWIRYAQAAARVLPDCKRGMRAHVAGSLIGSGLSSSASVGLAYIKALADVNDIELSGDDLVRLDFELENRQLGLHNGKLDPLTIVYGRKNALLLMDPMVNAVSPIINPPQHDIAWIVAYSGISRELIKSGYNVRVKECREAAAILKDGAEKLSDVPRIDFEEKSKKMPAHLCRRAEHFFGEIERVQRGVQAWKDGSFALFGQLMNESCTSSIEKYESGSELVIELSRLMSVTKGIYGSRFSGGGFGGCVVALAEKNAAESVGKEISAIFSKRHPELPSKIFVAEIVDGLTTLPSGEL